MCKICDKNISKEKHEKLKYLFKMKEWHKTALRPNKNLTLFDKRTLG